ncbi:NAD(P)-binding protein, partial [Pseudomaricurvus alcaniphilus]|uniref:FAD-dependent monooxygenase n=1 Tax=Pseudomaricurvus alcaniphilus TaxID=1166482 RepID=UPI00140B6920
MSSEKKIIIVGAGISGLTLAHSVKRMTDYEVRVIEKDTPANLLGTGINLLGNALRALDQVGLGEACLKHGKGWSEVSLADGAGNIHRTIKTGNSHREGFPAALGIMRPVFGKILEENALASGAKIDYQTTVTDIVQSDGKVTVTLSNGEIDTCDLLVAADGALSATRKMVFGDHLKGEYV